MSSSSTIELSILRDILGDLQIDLITVPVVSLFDETRVDDDIMNVERFVPQHLHQAVRVRLVLAVDVQAHTAANRPFYEIPITVKPRLQA